MEDLGLVQEPPRGVARDCCAGNWADGCLVPVSADYAGAVARLAAATAVHSGRLEQSRAASFTYDDLSTDEGLISQMRQELPFDHAKLIHDIIAVELWLSGSLCHCLADSDE